MGSIAEVAALTMLFEACEDEQVKRNVMMLCPELRLFVGKVYMPEPVATQGAAKEPKAYLLVARKKGDEDIYLTRVAVCPPSEAQSYADRFQGQMEEKTGIQMDVTIEEQKSE